MPDWRLKTAVHGVISVLPRSQDLNYLLQRRVTGSVELTPVKTAARLAVVTQRYVGAYQAHCGTTLDGAHVVELGTGWHPIVPIALFLHGADRVTTFDIDPLLRDREVDATITAVLAAVADDGGTTPRPDRLERLREVAERSLGVAALRELGITAVVADARQSGLDDQSVDLVVSNNVMEHVGRALIGGLYDEFARITRTGGLLSQRIDMRDHFARVDRSIGPYNYLRYSERQWRWLGSRLEHQNRLRYPEHLRLLANHGWTLVADEPTFGSTTQFDKVTVHPEFLHLDRDDLRVLDTWMVATPTR